MPDLTIPDEAPVTTYVIDRNVPWPEDVAGTTQRGVFEAGAILDGAARHDCAIRKIAPQGATLRTAFRALPGSAFAVELGNGQRRSAQVEWARGGELGVAFAEPIDIVALINRNLVSQPAERRRMPRVELRRPLHVKWCEHLEPAVSRNISSFGMQVEGVDLPPVGTLASLFVEGINLPPAEVVWRQGALAGFEFFEEVRWASIIAWVREVGRRTPGL